MSKDKKCEYDMPGCDGDSLGWAFGKRACKQCWQVLNLPNTCDECERVSPLVYANNPLKREHASICPICYKALGKEVDEHEA